MAPESTTTAMEHLQISSHPDTSDEDQVEECSTTKRPPDELVSPAGSAELRKEGSSNGQQEDDDWGGFIG